MADFQFLKNPTSNKWVILAPRRSKRTNVGKKPDLICPFCIGREREEEEIYRIPARDAPARHASQVQASGSQSDAGWQIRVISNKFPFTPHHEIIIHSPDHHKNFEELPFSAVELILKTYRIRYLSHEKDGQVYIFHNRGHNAGESLPHPHTQLTVVPKGVHLDIPALDLGIYNRSSRFSLFKKPKKIDFLETEQFLVFCPNTSEWPDEVWIAPKKNGVAFGSITDQEITDFAFILCRIIQIFDHRHGNEFPFNFYIYPGRNWYLRFIPRTKVIGGFELGTQVIVNTQDPLETLAFIKEHFWEPNLEKIKTEHQAEYLKSV